MMAYMGLAINSQTTYSTHPMDELNVLRVRVTAAWAGSLSAKQPVPSGGTPPSLPSPFGFPLASLPLAARKENLKEMNATTPIPCSCLIVPSLPRLPGAVQEEEAQTVQRLDAFASRLLCLRWFKERD